MHGSRRSDQTLCDLKRLTRGSGTFATKSEAKRARERMSEPRSREVTVRASRSVGRAIRCSRGRRSRRTSTRCSSTARLKALGLPSLRCRADFGARSTPRCSRKARVCYLRPADRHFILVGLRNVPKSSSLTAPSRPNLPPTTSVLRGAVVSSSSYVYLRRSFLIEPIATERTSPIDRWGLSTSPGSACIAARPSSNRSVGPG
jgi:hypothetical protein